jgi:hypothetical protein
MPEVLVHRIGADEAVETLRREGPVPADEGVEVRAEPEEDV